MTDDSSVHPENIENKNVDPLTDPEWPVRNDTEVLLDPVASKPPRTGTGPEWVNTTAPKPPSVDQILRGEYTGWVPIIKAGESLQDAESRAEVKLDRIEAALEFEETVVTEESTHVESRQLPSEILETITIAPDVVSEAPVRKSTAWTNLVEDPDTAKSPAAALEEARNRIQAMRESLQYNIRRVSESFEHPVFNDEVVEEPVVEPVIEKPAAPIVQPVALQRETEIAAEATQSATPTIVTEAPAHEYVTSAPIGEAVAETKSPDASLELMIMRDEIKDLRTRLDASQKLIEDLMHRLTNLTELALKSRQN